MVSHSNNSSAQPRCSAAERCRADSAVSDSASGRVKRSWPLIAILVAAVFVCFLPVLDAGFVYDDTPNIVKNAHYRGLAPANLRWMFTTTKMGHYQPLSWLTLGIDYTIGKMNPVGYHLTNLLLHLVNVVLVYVLALRLLTLSLSSSPDTKKPATPFLAGAFITALLFGLHPLRVESVAWVTERRDVLGAAFLLLTVLAYLKAQSMPRRAVRIRWIAAALIAYALSLLSKAGGMTLPVILLILDWYPLRRFAPSTPAERGPKEPVARILLEKAPFLVLAIAAAVVAAFAQTGISSTLQDHNVIGRIAQASYGLLFYIFKTAVPLGLRPLYQLYLPVDPTAFKYAASMIAVALIMIVLWLVRRRMPPLVAAALCYGVLLSPVLGFLQSGPQEVAERYSYLPSIGPMMLIGGMVCLAGLASHRRRGLRALYLGATIASLCVACGLGFLTWRQCRVWKSDLSLWTHAAKHTDTSWLTYKNLGAARWHEGDLEGAIEAYRIARRINPVAIELNLATLLIRTGRHEEAVRDLDQILGEHPSLASAHALYGRALAGMGDLDQAILRYRTALELEPDDQEIRKELVDVLRDAGRLDEAIRELELVLLVQPDQPDLLVKLGRILRDAGRQDEADDRFAQAIRLKPELRESLDAEGITVDESLLQAPQQKPQDIDTADIEAVIRRADQLAQVGQHREAAELYRKVLRSHPTDAVTHYKLGQVLSADGQYDPAIKAYNRAIELSPDFALAYVGLGNTYRALNDPHNALKSYQHAARADPNLIAAHYDAATVLDHLGRTKEAISAMRRALELAKAANRPDLIQRIEDRIRRYEAKANAGGTQSPE
jgi:tetratricopeptide (TPR) repeat protein